MLQSCAVFYGDIKEERISYKGKGYKTIRLDVMFSELGWDGKETGSVASLYRSDIKQYMRFDNAALSGFSREGLFHDIYSKASTSQPDYDLIIKVSVIEDGTSNFAMHIWRWSSYLTATIIPFRTTGKLYYKTEVFDGKENIIKEYKFEADIVYWQSFVFALGMKDSIIEAEKIYKKLSIKTVNQMIRDNII